MGLITLHGITNETMHLFVDPFYELAHAERDIEAVPIPGRNDEVIFDNGGWKPVKQKIPMMLLPQSDVSIADHSFSVVEWLTQNWGYYRYEDSRMPNHFRLARFSGPVNVADKFEQTGVVTVELVCRPEYFLKSGETAIVPAASQTFLQNATPYDSFPKIEIKGTGSATVAIGDVSVTVPSLNNGTVIIDSHELEVYRWNSTAGYATGLVTDARTPDGYPIIPSGGATLTYSGSGITSIKVYPRWFDI